MSGPLPLPLKRVDTRFFRQQSRRRCPTRLLIANRIGSVDLGEIRKLDG